MEARAAELHAENASIKLFVADRDATIVKEACSGLGTDDKQLIQVLCGRTKTQLEGIDQAYRTKYEKTLWEKVKGDVRGNYKTMLRYSLMERDEFVSHMIDKATSGFGTKECLLIDVLAPLSNDEITAAKIHWEAKNDESLVDKINSETSGGLRELIVALLTGQRTESAEADETLAEEQATNLYDAGVGKRLGTDDEVFIDVIGKSPSIQIQAIKAKYEETQGMSLHKAIGKEFRGDLKSVLQSMLEPPVDFYCANLKQATRKMGTDEGSICRVLGGNDKAQLAAISDRFTEKYDMTLRDMANAELRGHFKEAVLAWIDPTADPTGGVEQQLGMLTEAEDQLEERLKLLEAENDNMKQYIAEVDARQVRKACKGLGTDEDSIVSILCTRTKRQVERIDQAFRRMFEMTLREQLERDMSGYLKTFMVYTQMETQEFDALLMKQAMDGIGTDEDILIMVLTTRSNEAIAAAQTYYEGRFDESLVDKIDSEISGKFGNLLQSLLRGERNESMEADEEAAEAEAESLHTSDDKYAAFIGTLCTASRAQVLCIKEAYERKYTCSLAKTVKKKFHGNLEDALLSLLCDPVENFARGLKAAFHGIGTDKDAVCRILGGNDKPTCRAIAARYQEKYDRSLVNDLKDELRGTFEKGAVAWVSAIDPAAGQEGFRLAAENLEDEEDEGEEEEELATPPEEGSDAGGSEMGDEEQDEDGGDDDEGLEEAAGRMVLDNESDDGEVEDDEVEEEEAREARKEAKRQARKERTRRAKLRLARAKKESNVASKRNEARKKRKICIEKVARAGRLANEQVAFATERYGSEPICGLTIWGLWDSELYVKHNEDADGEHGWQHFRKNGFLEGRLIRIDNDYGAFVGALDMSAYVDRHGVDISALGRRRPFEKALIGFKHYVETGKDEDLHIPITQVVPIYLLGAFDPKRYVSLHKDVKHHMGPSRPGKFDDEGYRLLHPEVDEEGMEAFEHFKQNRENEIRVRGRVGLPNRRWYTKQYNKPFRHFFKKGYRQGLHIKVKAVPQSPLGHYCNQGWKEQRPLWFLTKVGAFYGVLDVEAFVEVNPAAGDSGTDPLKYYEESGRAAGDKLTLTKIEMRRLDTMCIDGNDVVGDTVEDEWNDDGSEEEEDEEDEEEEDDDDNDDDANDDSGDDDQATSV